VPRVLILTPDYPPALGGIQTLVHRVVRDFDRVEAHVVTVDHQGAAEFDARQAHAVTRVTAPQQVRRARTASLNRRAFDVASEFRPDLILSAHIVTSPAAAVLRRLRRVPVVQYVYAKELGAKPWLARFALRSADRVIAISRYAAQLAREHGGRPDTMDLITPGVDLPAGPIERTPAERPTMLTVSRLEDRYKGHDILIRALPLIRAQVPDLEWVVLGEGPLRPGLERMAAANGVNGAVRFLGAVSDGERDHWLRSAHVFAMPSRLPAGGFAGEGFGIVYLEANAHGMPVVAGNVAGALDAVVDGETGVLVDPADHIAVARGATRLLSDPDWAAQLGRTGLDRAQGFTWPVISRKVEDLLLDVANGARL
jgi:phosphatidylinositol alpha-1,6-mannosyltransferase